MILKSSVVGIMTIADRIDQDILRSLENVFEQVEAEWRANKRMPETIEPDDLTNIRYCPRLDFAVGPFNVEKNRPKWKINKIAINRVYNGHQRIIRRLARCDLELEEQWWSSNPRNTNRDWEYELNRFKFNKNTNTNPRCFIGIEVEKSPGQKHRMGSIMNAAALGKVGIIIAKGEAYRHLIRIRLYLRFLLAVEKPGVPISNVLIIPKRNFVEILSSYH